MNFVYNFGGGIQIESRTIKLYKKADVIETSPYRLLTSGQSPKVITENYQQLNMDIELCYYNLGQMTEFEQQILPILGRMEKLQFIGDNPLKHWAQNQVTCKLDIINPDLTIQDKPIIPNPEQKDNSRIVRSRCHQDKQIKTPHISIYSSVRH